MYLAKCTLSSASPLSQSKALLSARKEREAPDAFDERVWKERLHVNKEGFVVVPPQGLKLAVESASKYLNMRVPGGGKSTYTKNFTAGMLCEEPMALNVKASSVTAEKLFVPADGERGGSKRVWRHFPYIEKWKGTAQFLILDEAITEEVFTKALEGAGRFVGLGRFRPQRGGYYGRFKVDKVVWRAV